MGSPTVIVDYLTRVSDSEAMGGHIRLPEDGGQPAGRGPGHGQRPHGAERAAEGGYATAVARGQAELEIDRPTADLAQATGPAKRAVLRQEPAGTAGERGQAGGDGEGRGQRVHEHGPNRA